MSAIRSPECEPGISLNAAGDAAVSNGQMAPMREAHAITDEPSPGTPRLEVRGLSKSFGSVRACEDVSLHLARGEIVALLGENGAGKSTLVKMLFGALQPDRGTIEWDGREVGIPEPAAARRLGIGMVHQHFSLFEAFTVAENIALGLDDDPPLRRVIEEAREVSAAYGLPLDPGALVADLSVGERQRVEVVRCLMQSPDLIIMDEPTSVLTFAEAEALFGTLRRLRDEGRTILYISHKLEEVRALCSRAVVMRAGRVVGEYDPREAYAAELARAMVGSDVPQVRPVVHHANGLPMLSVRNLNLAGEGAFDTPLRDVSFAVRPGEVLGIAGMAGNGQTQLFAALSGEQTVNADAVMLDGEAVGSFGIDARRARGAAFVPEERLGHGAVPDMDLTDNVVLSRHGHREGVRGTFGALRRGIARRIAGNVIETMDVRTSGVGAAARSLSGGNLQKFVVGREIDRAPALLVVDQPTWGVDAGSAARLRLALLNLAAEGTAVVVISQDLDELFEIADRIAVISGGRLGEARPSSELTREQLGLEMGGQVADEVGVARAA